MDLSVFEFSQRPMVVLLEAIKAAAPTIPQPHKNLRKDVATFASQEERASSRLRGSQRAYEAFRRPTEAVRLPLRKPSIAATFPTTIESFRFYKKG